MASAALHCYACQGVFPVSTHPEERDEDGERLCPGCGSTFVELIDEERQQSQGSAAPRDLEGSAQAAATTGGQRDARGPRIEIRATFDQPAMPGPLNFVEAISRFAPVQLPNGQQAFVLQVQDEGLSPLNMSLPFGDMFPRTMNPADWVVGDDLDVVVTRALDAYRPAPLPVAQPVVDALPRRRVRAGPLSPRPSAAVEQAAQAAAAAAAEVRSARAAAAAAAEARAARAAGGAGADGGQGSEERMVRLQLGVGQGEAGAVRVQLTPCGQGAKREAGHGEQLGTEAGSGRERQEGNAERAGEEQSRQDEWASCLPGEQCTVCHDAFETGGEVVELPCRHCFHEDCILPWLRQRNTCPVCRTRLEAARDPLRSAQRWQEGAAAREAQQEDTDRRFAASIERRMQEATPQEAERLRLQFLVPVQERQRRREERRQERQEPLQQGQQQAPAPAPAHVPAQVQEDVPLVGMLQHLLQPPRAGPLSLQALAAAERAFAPLNERFQPLRCREDVPVGRPATAQRPQPPHQPQAAAANQGQPSLSFLPRGFLNMHPATAVSSVMGALVGAPARARERQGEQGAAAAGRAPAGGATGPVAGSAAGNGTANRGSALRGGFFASRPTPRAAGNTPQQQQQQQAPAPGAGRQVPAAAGPSGTDGQAGAAGASTGGPAGSLPDFHPQMSVYKQKAAQARARTQAIRERLGAGTSGAAGPEGGAGASAAVEGASTSAERTAFYKEKAAHARARTQAILASMNPARAAVMEQQGRPDGAAAAAQEHGHAAPDGDEGDGEAEGAPGRQVARTSRADDAATRANAAGKQGAEEGGGTGAGGSRDAAAPAGRSAGGAPHVRAAGRAPVRAVAAGRRTGARPGTRAASGGPGSSTAAVAEAQPQGAVGGPSSSGPGPGLDRTRSGSAGSAGGLNPISLVVGGAGAGLRFLAGAATGLLRRGGNGSSGGAGASSGGAVREPSPPPSA